MRSIENRSVQWVRVLTAALIVCVLTANAVPQGSGGWGVPTSFRNHPGNGGPTTSKAKVP